MTQPNSADDGKRFYWLVSGEDLAIGGPFPTEADMEADLKTTYATSLDTFDDVYVIEMNPDGTADVWRKDVVELVEAGEEVESDDE